MPRPRHAWSALALLVLPACSGGPATSASSGDGPAGVPAAATTVVPTTATATDPTASPPPWSVAVGERTSTTTSSSSTSSSSTSTTTSTTVDPASLLPTLAEGEAGPEVVTLQRMLNNVTGTSLRPDGVFGPDTTRAITAFQLWVKLPVSGVADHASRTLLAELDAGRSTAIPTWPVPSIGNGGPDGCQVAVVGDSLMAGAAAIHERALAAVGCASAVDGVGGRSLDFGWQCRITRPDGSTPLVRVDEPEPGNTTCAPSGLELLRLWSDAQALGDLVVVALGTNDAGIHADETTWIAHWERALELTGGRAVVFVTTAARPGSRRVATQAAYSASLRRWCDTRDRCHLADWALTDAAADAASYVDAVHLRRVATERRAAFIADAVRRLLTAPPSADPDPLPTSTTTTTTTTSTTTTTASTTTTTVATTTTATTTTTTTTSPTTTTTTSPSTTTSTSPSTTTTTTTTSTSTPATSVP